MKRIIILVIIMFICSNFLANAQSLNSENKRKKEMISFLVENGELDKTNNDFDSYKDFVFQRRIYHKKQKGMLFEIFIFGANSSHSKSFVCLSRNTNHILETKELNLDIKKIVEFISQSSHVLNTSELLVFFDKISICYTNNKKKFFDVTGSNVSNKLVGF